MGLEKVYVKMATRVYDLYLGIEKAENSSKWLRNSEIVDQMFKIWQWGTLKKKLEKIDIDEARKKKKMVERAYLMMTARTCHCHFDLEKVGNSLKWMKKSEVVFSILFQPKN